MLKGHLGIVAAVVVIALTAGGYALIAMDSAEKADAAARRRVSSSFHAVRSVTELDAQSVKAHAQRYALRTSTVFTLLEAYRRTVAAEFAKCAAGLGEDWTPDFMALLDRKNIVVWSQLNSTVSKSGTPTDFATNRRIRDAYVDMVKLGKTSVAFGTLKLKGVLTSPLNTVAVPLLGANNRVLVVVLLAWKGKINKAEVEAKALAFQSSVNVVVVIKDLKKVYAGIDALLGQRFPRELKNKYGITGAFVGLLDKRGVLMRRSDGSTNSLFIGEQLAPKSQALSEARVQKFATTQIWPKEKILEQSSRKNKGASGRPRPEMLRVGFGPVLDQRSQLVGVLVVAWPIGVYASHLKLADITGGQVVLLSNKELSSASLKRVSASALVSVKQTNLGPHQWKKPAISAVTIEGQKFLAAAGRLPRGGQVGAYSYVVLASVDRAKEPFGYAKVMVLVLGAVVALLFLVVSWVVRRYFILSLDELEKGVANIVAGNMEHTFGVPSRETEGLAYSLNVLMAQLLGRPEPGEEDEEDEEGGGGARILFSLGPLPDRAYRAGDSQLIPRLDEDRPTYFKRIFGEYLRAMQDLGEDTDGMDIEAFQRKLDVNERMICARLKCSEVRFSVVSGDEEVVLQPYPIS
jgi:HAMP domain-containing protein